VGIEHSEGTAEVLVVTDDPIVREAARFGFSHGTRVVFALDARQALESIQGHKPSVAIVDLQTGSAGGFGLIRDVRATSALADLPVLLLVERKQDEWLAKQAGATAIGCKPIGAGDLVRATLALISSGTT